MLYFVIFVSLAGGLFIFLAGALKFPYRSVIRAQVSLKKRIASGKLGFLDIKLERFSAFLAKYLRLGSYRREELEDILKAQEIDLSPEAFTAGCIIKAGLIAILAVPAIFIFPLAIPLILFAAFVVFYNLFQRPYKLASKKKSEIESVLPAFVNHTSKILKHSRDVLYIISSYSEYASGVFARELLVTEADMRSGNYELALTRLESRVGSSMLSDVTRGLISIIHGDDTVEYWKNLEIKFRDYQKQLLKQKALRVPAKVRRLSMALMICFMLLYMTVMATVIITNLSALL